MMPSLLSSIRLATRSRRCMCSDTVVLTMIRRFCASPSRESSHESSLESSYESTTKLKTYFDDEILEQAHELEFGESSDGSEQVEGFTDMITKLNEVSRKDRHRHYRFVDKVALEVSGGKGGNGCISYDVLSPGKRRSTGGNGGKGGNVYVAVDKSLTSLNFQNFHFNAGNGSHGKGDGITGRTGTDAFIYVPLGTMISEKIPDYVMEQFDEGGFDSLDANRRFELNKVDDIVLVAEGGEPGTGNKLMKGSQANQKRSTPMNKIPGQPGQKRTVLLELKLIADVGLVGYPNAGKSSLLRCLSNARPKVASYAFTTLHPSVGVVDYSDLERITVADIPGLIDGASDGKGLGHDFLRHVERTKILLYVIDAACTDGRTPNRDLKSLYEELRKYSPELIKKPAIVFANKMDLQVNQSHMRMLRSIARKMKLHVIEGSTEDLSGIAVLAERLRNLVSKREAGNPIEVSSNGLAP